MPCTATPDISSSRKNISSTARVSRPSFRGGADHFLQAAKKTMKIHAAIKALDQYLTIAPEISSIIEKCYKNTIIS